MMANRVVSPVKKYFERKHSFEVREEDAKWRIEEPLPKLHVPHLHKTLDRYLKVMEAILTPPQYAECKRLVTEFGSPGGLGERLQQELEIYATTLDNWAYSWWLDDMYMNNHLGLPINSNPGMVFPSQKFTSRAKQIRFAAKILSGILDYKIILDARGLPIDRANTREKGQPLCMEQYYRLFSTYRLPGIDRDSLFSLEEEHRGMADPEHVIVMYKGQMFVLDIALHFQQLSEDNMFYQLKRIVRRATFHTGD